jgi:hypothetical protein
MGVVLIGVDIGVVHLLFNIDCVSIELSNIVLIFDVDMGDVISYVCMDEGDEMISCDVSCSCSCSCDRNNSCNGGKLIRVEEGSVNGFIEK